MHAALSVILFTVLSGAGLGAFVCVAAADIARALGARAGDVLASPANGALALGLVVVGLCASVLHLANPRNAWRSATRFRTSWLSREAVFALLFLVVAGAWLALRYGGWAASVRPWVAALGIALAWAVIVCTAMIYASLKPIRAWHTRRVPLNFLLLAHASGAVLLVALSGRAGGPAPQLAWIATALLAAAALAKWNYRRYLASDDRSVTLEAALGVARGVRPARAPATVAARILDVGHSRGTFLTREFGVTPTPARRAVALAAMAVGLYAGPLAWLVAGTAGRARDASAAASPGVALVVCLAMFAGLLAERWLFFVEARHTVRLFHGERRT
jgi:sulfite dehydrogenase (quinone) subunit SoeC